MDSSIMNNQLWFVTLARLNNPLLSKQSPMVIPTTFTLNCHQKRFHLSR